MQRTIRFRLNPTPDQSAALLETMRQHAACFNAVAAHGWEHSQKNGVRLHHATYYSLRERFPELPAQLVIAARVRATEAVRSALALQREQGIVGLSSLIGRLKMPSRTDPYAQGLLAQAVGFDSADLIRRKGRFWLHAVVTLPDVQFQPSGVVVGVLSRRIVDFIQPGTVIAVENLGHIRRRVKQRGRESRRRLHSWSFDQLRAFLSYKAEAHGCRIAGVDPRHTSQMCSRCGHTHRSNRRSQSRFLCRACGFELNADLNASRNIARKHLAGGGMTTAGGPSSTGPSCQSTQAD